MSHDFSSDENGGKKSVEQFYVPKKQNKTKTPTATQNLYPEKRFFAFKGKIKTFQVNEK